MRPTSCWPSLCHNQTISLTLLPLLLLVLASWTCHQKSQCQLNCLDAGDANTVHQEAGLVCEFPSSKTNLGFIFNEILHAQHLYSLLFGQDSQKEASQLDQFEKEAFTSLAKAKAKAAAEGLPSLSRS